jgi:hypothetical protein
LTSVYINTGTRLRSTSQASPNAVQGEMREKVA